MIRLEWKVTCELRVDWPPFKKGHRVVIDKFSSHQFFRGLYVHVCEPWKDRWLPDWAVTLYQPGETKRGI